MSTRHVAFVETPSGIWRETNGVMEGPFTRAELGADLSPFPYIGRCQMLRAFGPASISFGFGYGVKADNRFAEEVLGGR